MKKKIISIGRVKIRFSSHENNPNYSILVEIMVKFETHILLDLFLEILQ